MTLLERPMRGMTLLSTVEAGLRARRRQYELRDHLAERQRRSEEVDDLLDVSRVTSGKIEITRRPVASESLVTLRS